MTNYANMSVATLAAVDAFASHVSYTHMSYQNGMQMRAEFPNGYSVSVVSHAFSYGGEEGLWEGAVMYGGRIVYDTPVTDDVIGWMNEDEVLTFCRSVADLPAREA